MLDVDLKFLRLCRRLLKRKLKPARNNIIAELFNT